jgi:hypothetical protein
MFKVSLITLEILCLLIAIIFIVVNFNLRKSKFKSFKFCAVEDFETLMENKSENSFYIHLLSNVKNHQSHRNNTVANFVTKLPDKINLTNEWEVGLAEISYTKSWFNIRENFRLSIFTTDHRVFLSDEAILRKGYYTSTEILIAAINNKLKVFESALFKNEIKKAPSLRYDSILNRLFITNGISMAGDSFIYPSFDSELELILGLRNESKSFLSFFYDEEKNKPLPDNMINLNKSVVYVNKDEKESHLVEIQSPFPVQFNATELYLLIYCNIVKPVMIGNIRTNLLRQVEIPRKAKFGDQCVLRYPEPFYYPVVSYEFESIEIDIKDDTDQRVLFDFGRSTVTLHFRKINASDA